MENILLQTTNLTKKFGSFIAVDNVSITLRKGHIYGFIGENGAGKTTLMRIFTGLLYQTSGEVSMFGKTNTKELEKVRKHIGSTIEEPALYPNFSAYENLEIQRILTGNPDKSVCDEVLRLTDLYEYRNKKVRKFSMGMKQRLSIALALIGNPQLLILDEPVNGLDPKGIATLRKTLKRLNEEKDITLFISSHILNELYLLATDYIIIHKGKIIDTLTLEELETKCRRYISIRMNDVATGITVLEKKLEDINYKVMDNGTVRLFSHTNEVEKIAKLLSENNVLVTELSLAEQTLEEYFLSVTGGASNV